MQKNHRNSNTFIYVASGVCFLVALVILVLIILKDSNTPIAVEQPPVETPSPRPFNTTPPNPKTAAQTPTPQPAAPEATKKASEAPPPAPNKSGSANGSSGSGDGSSGPGAKPGPQNSDGRSDGSNTKGDRSGSVAGSDGSITGGPGSSGGAAGTAGHGGHPPNTPVVRNEIPLPEEPNAKGRILFEGRWIEDAIVQKREELFARRAHAEVAQKARDQYGASAAISEFTSADTVVTSLVESKSYLVVVTVTAARQQPRTEVFVANRDPQGKWTAEARGTRQ